MFPFNSKPSPPTSNFKNQESGNASLLASYPICAAAAIGCELSVEVLMQHDHAIRARALRPTDPDRCLPPCCPQHPRQPLGRGGAQGPGAVQAARTGAGPSRARRACHRHRRHRHRQPEFAQSPRQQHDPRGGIEASGRRRRRRVKGLDASRRRLRGRACGWALCACGLAPMSRLPAVRSAATTMACCPSS